MVKVQDNEFPDHLLYDIENQIWYEPLADGTVRAGFTSWAVTLMGEVLVFTPKRIGRDFEKGRSFATIEGGKWVGSARAAFDGVVVSHNESLIRKPELLMQDAYGAGFMLVVRPARDDWRTALVTGPAIAPMFEAWLATGSYQKRTGQMNHAPVNADIVVVVGGHAHALTVFAMRPEPGVRLTLITRDPAAA